MIHWKHFVIDFFLQDTIKTCNYFTVNYTQELYQAIILSVSYKPSSKWKKKAGQKDIQNTDEVK